MSQESNNSPTQFDSTELRQTLGHFATGVTVVTSTGNNGVPIGMTVNSFSSVSLEPPLILWSLGADNQSRDEFLAASHFAVHILDIEQRELSDRFALRGNDKFEGIEMSKGIGDVPLLPNHLACLECSMEHHYSGGDHTIIVGRVLRLTRNQGSPLLFYRGGYTSLTD